MLESKDFFSGYLVRSRALFLNILKNKNVTIVVLNYKTICW